MPIPAIFAATSAVLAAYVGLATDTAGTLALSIAGINAAAALLTGYAALRARRTKGDHEESL